MGAWRLKIERRWDIGADHAGWEGVMQLKR
jgi:hypothetical protein